MCLRRNRKPLAHPPNWADLEEQELGYLRAEHTRLPYLAATQANEHLIVGQWSGSHASISHSRGRTRVHSSCVGYSYFFAGSGFG